MPSKLSSQKAKLSSVVATLDPNMYDPSTRSESSSRKSESYKSPSTKTSSSPSATPSIDHDCSDSNESFYSASQLQDEEEEGPISEPKSESDIKNGKSSAYSHPDQSANQYLDKEDLFTAKKLLGKLCKTMVESSCHHGKKDQQLNANLFKLQQSFADNISVLKDFVIDFDLKSADKLETMIQKLDPQMTALEEISRFSRALDSMDDWLDHTDAENQRDLDTIKKAKQHLQKQKEFENKVKHLEEQSHKHRSIFNAVELNDPVLLRQAVADVTKKSSSSPLGYKRYGVKENKHFIPEFMANIDNFEANISQMKRFFIPAGLLSQKYFDKMELLLKNVKNEIDEHFTPLSTASSMASLLAPVSENPTALCTSDYYFVPSSNDNEDDDNELEIEVSQSDTNSGEASLSLSNESIQQPSVYDTVEDSTQASSKLCDTVASTQASSCGTVDATQLSASNKSISQTSSSVSTCSSFELECDITQNSDESVDTGRSPKSSSLKTALSWDDLMGSSSTIAI